MKATFHDQDGKERRRRRLAVAPAKTKRVRETPTLSPAGAVKDAKAMAKTKQTRPSQELKAEAERLERARADQAAEVARLKAEMEEHQEKLDAARAAGVIGRADADAVAAFIKELEGLKQKLAEAKSTQAGLEALLATAREELAAVRAAEIEAALETEAFASVRQDLEKNAQALEEARAAFLETLEAGAGPLVAEAGPLLERWEALAQARYDLYCRQCSLTDAGEPDRKMRNDPLASLFPDEYAREDVMWLVEALLPLVEVYFGYPRVRGRERLQRPWR